MIIKKISIIFLVFPVVCFFMIAAFATSCFPSVSDTESPAEQETAEPAESDNGSKNVSAEEDFDSLLETKGFIEVFNSFYYIDSDIREIKHIGGDDSSFYMLLETDENPQKVEEHYKNKKAQSIWNRAVIYEKSADDIEDKFLEEEDKNIPIYKYTYNSNNKDEVVNVLIKGLEEDRTRVMIIYWNLQ
jgi:hypothetical protein